MKAEKFEDLKVWNLSREMAVEIYKITSKNNFKKDFGLSNQIQRAGVSILSNIAEGFERETNKEFIRFLYIAKGSVGEVRAQLYLALDLNYIDEPTFNGLFEKTMKISGMLSSFIKYLQEDLRGSHAT